MKSKKEVKLEPITISKSGITLIALVVTIIVLLILAGITISLVIGQNGIFTRATDAKQKMEIAQGKEEIDIAVLEIVTDKIIQNEPCFLEDIKQELPNKLNLVIVGEKGEPLEKIYVDYKGHEYEIDEEFETQYVGNVNINEEPEISLIQDKTATGVEKVVITAKAKVIDGVIEKIENPEGKEISGEQIEYEVTKNGEYLFKAYTNKGRKVEKVIKIENIKEEGIDLTGLVTGSEQIEHICLWENKYDNNYHWEECSICSKVKNKVGHTKTYVGGEVSCSASVPARYEVCSTNCGYSKNIPKLSHVSDGKYYLYGWYHYNKCVNCGAAFQGVYCTFELADGSIVSKGNSRIHEAGEEAQCTVCKNKTNLSKHAIMPDSNLACMWCDVQKDRKKYIGTSPEAMREAKANEVIKVDLLDGKKQYVYLRIKSDLGEDIRLDTLDYSANCLNLANTVYQTLADGSKIYQIEVSTKSSTQMLNKNFRVLNRNFFRYESNPFGDNMGPNANTHPIDLYFNVADNNAPEIIEAVPNYIDYINGWARGVSVTITGKAKQKEMVYVSFYDEEGNPVVENVTVKTDGAEGNFTYAIRKPIEAGEMKNYTVKVRDYYGNESSKKVEIRNIDSKPPIYVSQVNLEGNWSRKKTATFAVTDKGIGEVQIAFNQRIDYQLADREAENYTRSYCFVGDIYNTTNSIIYFRDKLENEAIQKIQIGQIDNTSPNVTNVTQEKLQNGSTKVIIEANDKNSILQKEGSGIKGYAISTSAEIPNKNSFQASNEFYIERSGTYYIFVVDKVGNYSERQELVI